MELASNSGRATTLTRCKIRKNHRFSDSARPDEQPDVTSRWFPCSCKINSAAPSGGPSSEIRFCSLGLPTCIARVLLVLLFPLLPRLRLTQRESNNYKQPSPTVQRLRPWRNSDPRPSSWEIRRLATFKVCRLQWALRLFQLRWVRLPDSCHSLSMTMKLLDDSISSLPTKIACLRGTSFNKMSP